VNVEDVLLIVVLTVLGTALAAAIWKLGDWLMDLGCDVSSLKGEVGRKANCARLRDAENSASADRVAVRRLEERVGKLSEGLAAYESTVLQAHSWLGDRGRQIDSLLEWKAEWEDDGQD